MIKELVHDPLFLGIKSKPATKEDILLDLMSPRERALFREETAPARQLSLFGEETPTLSPMERKELSCLAAPM